MAIIVELLNAAGESIGLYMYQEGSLATEEVTATIERVFNACKNEENIQEEADEILSMTFGIHRVFLEYAYTGVV